MPTTKGKRRDVPICMYVIITVVIHIKYKSAHSEQKCFRACSGKHSSKCYVKDNCRNSKWKRFGIYSMVYLFNSHTKFAILPVFLQCEEGRVLINVVDILNLIHIATWLYRHLFLINDHLSFSTPIFLQIAIKSIKKSYLSNFYWH